MLLIIGLGNPGKKFKKTRHNVGFLVIDEFSRENDFPDWQESKKNNCLYAKKEIASKEIELIKPLVFMNNSGRVAKSISRKHNLKPGDILVVHDDVALPLGKIKIVQNRGAAGHKGVESIIRELKTKEFSRFRIGIKPLEIKNVPKAEKFVLQNFSKNETKIIQVVVKKTCQAIKIALEENLNKAMQKYNQ